MNRKVGVVILLITTSIGTRASEFDRKEIRKVQLDQLVQACHTQAIRDEVCNTLIELKQIGDDAVEALKTYIPMGPFEYAILTAGNYAATGRLRFRPKPFIHPKIRNVIDFQKDGTTVLYIQADF